LIGAAEDGPDHFVEHNESGVGENRFDLDGVIRKKTGDELPFVPRTRKSSV
jgi:hypothetical protein